MSRFSHTAQEVHEYLGDFNPETSTRERRKLRAGVYKKSTYNSNAIHDRDGKMIEDGSDFCDCLDPDCPGCHFPCVKCGSQKCSVDCRKNRKWTPDVIELEGTNHTWTLDQACKKQKQKAANPLRGFEQSVVKDQQSGVFVSNTIEQHVVLELE